MKRKPPPGNVRRVASISTNIRYTITNKANRTVQCESFNERKLALLFDRDPTIRDYGSQPERFEFLDSNGRKHTYVPDFIVWRTNGTIEIHECTLEERRDKPSSLLREEAANKICGERGWTYIVHTENTLPSESETANLIFLYSYRSSIYCKQQVIDYVADYLQKTPEKPQLRNLIELTSNFLELGEGLVSGSIYHMLWMRIIETDFDALIFLAGRPSANCSVWLPI